MPITLFFLGLVLQTVLLVLVLRVLVVLVALSSAKTLVASLREMSNEKKSGVLNGSCVGTRPASRSSPSDRRHMAEAVLLRSMPFGYGRLTQF